MRIILKIVSPSVQIEKMVGEYAQLNPCDVM